MSNEMDRRLFLQRSGLVAAGIVAVGASGGVLDACSSKNSGGPASNGVSNATPKTGGSLIFGLTSEPTGFNPTLSSFASSGVMYARTVFDPLTIVTPTGGWKPYLAESITPNVDYTKWTVTLRPTILFHDGTPCDGAALLTNFEAQFKGLLTQFILHTVVTSYKQTGPLTVQMILKEAWVPLPYYMAGGIGGQIAYLMAPSMINAKNFGTTHPVGTGPFKLTEWIPNTHFTAAKWDKYWQKDLPHLDKITFKPIPTDTARIDALDAGTIDMLISDTPKTIKKYRNQTTYSFIDDSKVSIGEPTMNCIMLNLSKPPFTTKTVRLACAMSISRQTYAKTIDTSVNPVSTGLFQPTSPYFSSTTLPQYNPTKAKQLIQAVEARTGKPVTFQLGSTTSGAAIKAATYAIAHFNTVGMKVTTKPFAQGEFIKNAEEGTFQAYTWRQFGAIDPDLNYIFWSQTDVSRTGLGINFARNTDPTVQKALITGRTSLTKNERIQAYKTVNERFAIDLPYLWADRATWGIAAKSNVQNFNNPKLVTGGSAFGFINGILWTSQIWMD